MLVHQTLSTPSPRVFDVLINLVDVDVAMVGGTGCDCYARSGLFNTADEEAVIRMTAVQSACEYKAESRHMLCPKVNRFLGEATTRLCEDRLAYQASGLP